MYWHKLRKRYEQILKEIEQIEQELKTMITNHPGVNKNYPVKLNGYDLELLGEVSRNDPNNTKLGLLISKIARQVPYQF